MTIEETTIAVTEQDGNRLANVRGQGIKLYVSLEELKAIAIGAVLTRRMYNGPEAKTAEMMLHSLRAHLERKSITLDESDAS